MGKLQMKSAGNIVTPSLHGPTFSFATDADVALTKEELSSLRKHGHRRTSACTVLSEDYLFRRAYSEQSLLQALDYKALDRNTAYLFASEGDVDQMSYLKIAIAAREHLDYVLLSTWVMAAEDVLQLQQWCEDGRIGKVELCFGEIFPKQYKIEWGMIRDFQRSSEHAGRVAVFKNHSKVILACSADWYYACMTSANITTNPRAEQACILLHKEVFDFYSNFYNEKLELAEKKRKKAEEDTAREQQTSQEAAAYLDEY